ncbi:MAG: PucR family transcriptional regulator ligand-binding domain-containing protein, partial [Peptostreptococcaceae bacterium]
MSVALEYLYQDIKEHEVKLLAGKNGLKNKVRWIHTVESEDTATLLQGEEIVFTTGIAIKN